MHRIPFLLLVVGGLLPPIGRARAAAPPVLRVYAYDSFLGKGSLGELVAQTLQRKQGIRTEYVSFSSAGEALNQLALEAKSPRADLIVGIDNSLLARARDLKLLRSLSDVSAKIPKELAFDSSQTVIPFDYGDLALVYDRTRVTALPTSLAEFAANPSIKRKLALEDPRTSSVGLAFLLWTVASVPKEGLEGFWKQLSDQVMTIAPGWSGAYGVFLQKEADWVVSDLAGVYPRGEVHPSAVLINSNGRYAES